MTQVATPPAAPGPDAELPPVPAGHVRLTIDGVLVDAPKGELVIRAAERIGIAIPRFCDHPLLEPVGACRQCLVEVEMGGRPMPKPQASCTQTVADGMVVKTQLSSPVAEKAQRSNLEFLLLNHPLDCPICDKGGECPLQNQVLANGSGTSRLRDPKRVFTKPIAVSTEILLDRERCVLCQRCTRFSDQIAGDPFIDLLERGSMQQIGINSSEPFQSYFSGNTIQICPVGALTSAAYRFRARPFDLVSTDTVCEHCSSGCALRTDHRAGAVTRRLARADDDVNEEWNCDKGRFAFPYVTQPDRIERPLIRGADGMLRPASWTEAMQVAAAGLAAARDSGGVGVLAGGRLTVTDAYAYAKFARLALRTNDIDFRARTHSAEEADFLATRIAGPAPNAAVTYAALDVAPVVLLVALEPEEESPILFLRLRKAARAGVPVLSVAAVASRGLDKLSGGLLGAVPGAEADVLAGLRTPATGDTDPDNGSPAALLRRPGAAVLVGERASEVPGLLTAVGELVDATGAGLAWVPRRAGERGALEAGALPALLPGGRPLADPAARAEVEAAWGARIPEAPGRDTAGILAAIGIAEDEPDDSFYDTVADSVDDTVDNPSADELPAAAAAAAADDTAAADAVDAEPELGTPPEFGLAGLLVGGVEISDLPDPAAALAAVASAGFVVSLEIRQSAVTELAHVVFPVAAAAEKSGAYLTWEGRPRPFAAALPEAARLDDARVLDTLGVEMDVDLYTQTPAAATAELERLGTWNGPRHAREVGFLGRVAGAVREAVGAAVDSVSDRIDAALHPDSLVLASWRMNLDGSRALDGEPHLAGTAKPDVARLSAAEAATRGLADGDLMAVRGPASSVTLPLAISAMVDGAVWVPARIDGIGTPGRLGAGVGDRVRVEAVGPTGRPHGSGTSTGTSTEGSAP